ncbi:TrbI/VirB10 family protein [Proteus sp. fly-1013]|uniref:TrbI/VirB10 family protein n=1 Tax=Proteus sp. fly-1013 TaxID=3136673 RepID=UPI0032DBF1A3
MANLNSIILNNQRKLLILILIIILIFVSVVFFLNSNNDEIPSENIFVEDELSLEPDLTGSITNTFDNKVDSQLLTDSQTMARDNQKKVDEMTRSYQEVKEQLQQRNSEYEDLVNRLEELEKNKGITNTNNVNPDNSDPVPVLDNTSTIERIGGNSQKYYGNSQPTRQLSYSASQPITGSLETKTFTYKQKESASSKFYVPSGSFSNAIILEGADANASVTAKETDTTPMQFKLTGLLHMPSNNKRGDLENCFVTGAVYGDISSERGVVRTQRLSCIINDKHIDMAVKGHVVFYGKNGIKGVPVMRNGQVLGLAFTSGALSGLGSAISEIGSTSVGIGAEHQVTAGEVARQGAGKGVQTATNKLADYYISLAEQYHPIIPIGSANRVEIVFQEGFWAEFLEDLEREKNQPLENDEMQKNNEYSNINNSDLPPELVDQLGQIRGGHLDEFVTPNKGK